MNHGNYEVPATTLRFLEKTRKACAAISPPIAMCLSYRLLEFSQHRGVSEKGLLTKCQSCGVSWDPSGVRIRTKPRPVLRRNIRKLLAKEQHRPWLLSSRQKKLLKRFKQGTTILVFQCKACRKTLKQACPKDPKRRTSKANSSTLCYNKTPVVRPSTKKPTSSPAHVLLKKKKKENSVVQDTPKETASVKRNRSLLKRVLIEEDTRRSSTGGLQSFLSSL